VLGKVLRALAAQCSAGFYASTLRAAKITAGKLPARGCCVAAIVWGRLYAAFFAVAKRKAAIY
jgi:hypothetical protein